LCSPLPHSVRFNYDARDGDYRWADSRHAKLHNLGTWDWGREADPHINLIIRQLFGEGVFEVLTATVAMGNAMISIYQS